MVTYAYIYILMLKLVLRSIEELYVEEFFPCHALHKWLNLSAMLVSCVICLCPSNSSMINSHTMTLVWLRPMRLKITFPTLIPMHDGSHVFCVSALSCPEECHLKLEAICLPSLHALCVIDSICWNAKPSNKCKLCL